MTLIGRDDREPVLRGQLGAALAHAGLRAARARRRTTSQVLLRRALERGECGDVAVADEVIEFLAARSGGDARAALNALELALRHRARAPARRSRWPTPRTRCSARRVLYDKGGDQHYDYISAWIKSTRGSDPDASLYYLAAMLEGGEDARFIARRMIILASEDVGNADPQALAGRGRGRARGRARRAARVPVRARPGRDLPLAGAEVQRRRAARSAPRAAHIREHGAAPPPAALRVGRLPGGARARPRAAATTTRTTTRATSTTRSTCPRGSRTCASTTRTTPSRSCASGSSARARARGRPSVSAASPLAGHRRAARHGRGGERGGVAAAAAPRAARSRCGRCVPVASRARATCAAPRWRCSTSSTPSRWLLARRDRLAARRASCWPSCCRAVAGLHALADDGPRALADRRLGPARRAARAAAARALVQSPVGVVGLRGAVRLAVGRARAGGRGRAAGRQRACCSPPAAPLAAAAAARRVPARRAARASCWPCCTARAASARRRVRPRVVDARAADAPRARCSCSTARRSTRWSPRRAVGGVRRRRPPSGRGRAARHARRRLGRPLVERARGRGARGCASATRATRRPRSARCASRERAGGRRGGWSREAEAGGAERLCGGPVPVDGLGGAFYAPAVLRGVRAGARTAARSAAGPGAGGRRGRERRRRRSRWPTPAGDRLGVGGRPRARRARRPRPARRADLGQRARPRGCRRRRSASRATSRVRQLASGSSRLRSAPLAPLRPGARPHPRDRWPASSSAARAQRLDALRAGARPGRADAGAARARGAGVAAGGVSRRRGASRASRCGAGRRSANCG